MERSVPIVTVVIPCRMTEGADTTLNSLATQIFQGFNVMVIKDEGNGACWARNQGFEQTDTEYILFSDNDIEWKSHALETLMHTLKLSKASYSYGRYEIDGAVYGNQPWNPYLLKHHNYISTMSLWRTKDFPGWDENLKRLQDWDVVLQALEQGKRGVYCNDLIFTTKVRPGITYGPDLDEFKGYKEAEEIVKKKHNLV